MFEFELIAKKDSKSESSSSSVGEAKDAVAHENAKSSVDSDFNSSNDSHSFNIQNIISWCHRYSVEIIIAILGSIILFVPSWTVALQFDRNLVESGNYWLLITGQFTHFNLTHWVLDFVAIIIAAIHSPIGFNKNGWLQVVISLIVVGVGIWLFGDSTYYRGISGVVYGWLLLSVLRAPSIHVERFDINLITHNLVIKMKDAVFNYLYKTVFILLIILKVMSDIFGLNLFGIPGQIGADVSVAAHVFGLISVLFILPFQFKYIKKVNQMPQK